MPCLKRYFFFFFQLFPYSTQNNALRSLTRIRNDNPALPPFSVVDIAMTLRSPLESLIEFVSLTDAQYLAGQAIGAGDTRGDVKVEIKSVIVQASPNVVSLSRQLC